MSLNLLNNKDQVVEKLLLQPELTAKRSLALEVDRLIGNSGRVKVTY